MKTEGYSLRFPDGLRERIKEVATANKRSLNAEIIATLEAAYPDPKQRLRDAIRTLDMEIDKELELTRRDRLREARNQFLSELYFEPPTYNRGSTSGSEQE